MFIETLNQQIETVRMQPSGRTLSRCLATTVIVLCFAPAQAHRYEPINTEYAPPVEILTLDITPQYLSLGDGSDFYLVPEIGIEMPLTNWAQLEVSIPYLVLDPPSSSSKNGIGDLKLAFRGLLPGERPGPSLAHNFELGSPTGDRQEELGGEATELSIGLFGTQDLSRAILFGNFSYAAHFPKGGRSRQNILEYSTAAVFHAGHLFHPAVELFGESNLTEDETELFLAPELILHLNNRTELKWALPIGLTDSSPNWGLQFQLTIFF